MEQTKINHSIDHFKNIAKKNKICKTYAGTMIACLKCIGAIGNHFSNNYKRYLSMCATLVLFILSCSFTLPAAIGASANDSFYLSGKSESVVDQVLMEQVIAVDEELVEVDKEFNQTYQSTQIHMDSEVYSLDDLLEGTETSDLVTAIDAESMSEYDSLDPDSWNLILINKQHPVPDDYEVELATIKDGMECDARILPFLLEMFQAAKEEEGIELIVCSPYRDYERQEYLFNSKINSFMAEGFSYLDAYKLASVIVTVPGASEHQLGLAIDIISSTYWQLEVGFADTDAGIWLAENSYRFGFILRYPLGSEHITGVQFEPWHFRYVGVTAATMITEQGITLEEFVEGL